MTELASLVRKTFPQANPLLLQERRSAWTSYCRTETTCPVWTSSLPTAQGCGQPLRGTELDHTRTLTRPFGACLI